jgi:hypothetical protein
MKYDDRNGNGYRDNDTDEPGLNWEFEWDKCLDNNNCTNSWSYQNEYVTYSSSNGEGGRVGGLEDGTRIRIRERSRDGWTATTSTTVEITIHNNETILVRFGNRQTKPQVVVAPVPPKLPETGFDVITHMVGTVMLGSMGLYLRIKTGKKTSAA